MTDTHKHSSTPTRPAPAASLAGVSIAPRVPAPPPHETPEITVEKPDLVRHRLPIALPTPINDDEPSSAPAFGKKPSPSASPVIAPYLPEPEKIAPAAVIDLWEHLAADRLRPLIAELDPLVVARQWPNSLLLRVKEVARRPSLEVAHMFAPTLGGPTVPIPIDAMTVDWIVALGREVATTATPAHETDAVPTAQGAIPCGVIALPFGPSANVDHVLCHLYRVDETLLESGTLSDTRIPPRDRTGIRRLFGR